MTTKAALCAHLSIASYNIHKGVGADRKRDLARTAAVIAEIGADIQALQEVDTRFGTRKGLLDLTSLQRDLGLFAVPLAGVGAAHGWHGNLLLLRGALVQEVHQLILPGFEPRGAMVTDLIFAGQPLRIVNAHLGLLPASRSAQAQAMMDKLATLADRPTVLLGDLNTWGGRSLALRRLGARFTLAEAQPSFPARRPVLALDRMMASAPGLLRDIRTHDSALARLASDHLPLKARLMLGTDLIQGAV